MSSLVNNFQENKKNLSLNDCFIKIFYEGESARLYGDLYNKKVLIADNYFSGIEYIWEISLRRFADSGINFSNLELEIFTLFSEDKIYFEKKIEFKNGILCNLNSITIGWEWNHNFIKKVAHPGVLCIGCNELIVGSRYKCTVCSHFDYCEKCEEKYNGSHGHPFLKINNPQ